MHVRYFNEIMLTKTLFVCALITCAFAKANAEDTEATNLDANPKPTSETTLTMPPTPKQENNGLVTILSELVPDKPKSTNTTLVEEKQTAEMENKPITGIAVLVIMIMMVLGSGLGAYGMKACKKRQPYQAVRKNSVDMELGDIYALKD